MIKSRILDDAVKAVAGLPKDSLVARRDQRVPALISAWLGQAFDGMNTMMYFIVMYPALSDLLRTKDATSIGWHGGLILSIFTIGWAAGSVLFGLLADRFGTVKTMSGSILLYATASALCALSTHWWDLAFFRFLVGLGIGGECSLGAVLISECWPRERKLWALSIMNTSWPIGAALTGLFNLYTGVFGWRFLFAVGVLPALATFYIRANMKETKAFEEIIEKRAELKNMPREFLPTEKKIIVEHPLKGIFGPRYAMLTILVSTIISSCTVGFYGSIAWMPVWINQITGELAVQERSNASFYQSIGCLIACILPVLLVRRCGYRGALMIAFLGSFAIPFAMFTLVHNYVALTVNGCSVALEVFTTIPWIIMYSYLPEVYPTELLGTGAGFAWAVGRVLTAVAGLCAGPIIAFFHGLYGLAAAAFTLTYLIGLVAAIYVREPAVLHPAHRHPAPTLVNVS